MSADVAEMSMSEMLHGLEAGQWTSLDLVCAHLNRIAYFDRTGVCLNSVPVLNPDVMEEASASDARRREGREPRPLEGLPFTVKDSYMVAGLTVASGSPAFESLVATEDAASVAQLRAAGAVLIGKTTMPPMAAGGIQPGVHGYAKSPYNPGYLAAAYGSGSSNGAGSATAASLCAFGMAEETLSSGRSPASNNGLVAYTPSRGLISIRGNWPLFPTCDVVVPYARSVEDIARLLDVLVVEDPDTSGDFWRAQTVVDLPSVASSRPSSFLDTKRSDLVGLRIGVPRMFIGEDAEKSNPAAISPSVRALWETAAADLTRLGADVVLVDFPVVSNYEADRSGARGLVERGHVHPDWESTEMGPMIALAWDEFLRRNGMPGLSSLAEADGDRIFPDTPDAVYANAGVAFDYPRLVELSKEGLPDWEELPGFARSLRGLETARKEDLEDWMITSGLDAIAFPANGDVAAADLFERPEHMDAALRNGIVFSNGNRAIRHLGIPTLTVPMGRMPDISMPVGLTFAGPAYADELLLSIGWAYEAATQRRVAPPTTQTLPSSRLPSGRDVVLGSTAREDQLLITSSSTLDERSRTCLVDVDIELPRLDGDDVWDVSAWLDGRAMDVERAREWTRRAEARVSPALARVSPESLLVIRAVSPQGQTAHWESISLPLDDHSAPAHATPSRGVTP